MTPSGLKISSFFWCLLIEYSEIKKGNHLHKFIKKENKPKRKTRNKTKQNTPRERHIYTYTHTNIHTVYAFYLNL